MDEQTFFSISTASALEMLDEDTRSAIRANGAEAALARTAASIFTDRYFDWMWQRVEGCIEDAAEMLLEGRA